MNYHYTPILNLPAIHDSGVIRPSTHNLERPEHAAVWFSRNKVFEPTSASIARPRPNGGVERLRGDWFGYARISVPDVVAPYTWEDYCQRVGLSHRKRKDLLTEARRVKGRPMDWRVSFDPVPREHWGPIEVSWNNRWYPMGPAQKHGYDDLVTEALTAWLSGKELTFVIV